MLDLALFFTTSDVAHLRHENCLRHHDLEMVSEVQIHPDFLQVLHENLALDPSLDPVEALEVFRQKRAEVEAGAELQVDDDLKV